MYNNSISRCLFFHVYYNHPISYFLLNKKRITSTVSNNDINNSNNDSLYNKDTHFHKGQLINKEFALKRQNYVANIVKYYNTHKIIVHTFIDPLDK